MIKLHRNDLKTRYFLWCLENLPCRMEHTDADGKSSIRPVKWYVENGTTLCHFFWCSFWMPLITAAIISVFCFLLVMLHVEAYKSYGVPGLFLLSGIVAGFLSAVALIILALIGAGKAGSLPYLAALKAKICPRITFD